MIDHSRTRQSLILRLPTTSDAAAWQEFAAIYEPLILNFARRRGLQDADARELVQNVFLAVARAVADWRPDPNRGKFRAWLFRIARNQLINMMHKRQLAAGSGKTSAMLALQRIEDTNSPSIHSLDERLDEQLEIDYRRELFRSAAAFIRDEVQPATWQAFWMTSVEEVPVAKAAVHLEMTCGAIYIARSRVLHRLRELIQQWEDKND